MSRENSRGRRPFKVWDCSRCTRKALVVASLEELIVRGREKLGVNASENVKAVLEADGTQVDDSEYFRLLSDNTVFLLLRKGERWCPSGVDVIKAALSSIPKIVCEAISSLDLQNEAPSWKIMETRGRITIVLSWDHRPQGGYLQAPCSSSVRGGVPVIGGGSGSGIRTGIGREGKLETVIQDYSPKTPGITVVSHDDPPYDSVPTARSRAPPPLPPHLHQHTMTQVGASRLTHPQQHPYQYSNRGLPRQGSSSLESTGGATASVHVHTMECSQRGHFPPQYPSVGHSSGRGSPPEPTYCDFHCCALHEEGRKIQVHKAVATSPIQDPAFPQQQHQHDPRGRATGPSHHVRFSGVNGKNGDPTRYSRRDKPGLGVPATRGRSSSPRPPPHGNGHHQHHPHTFYPAPQPELYHQRHHVELSEQSSESETENNTSSMLEEDTQICTKFLLLIDQLSLDQKRHLTIKDIGVILERLSSKIIDVERLDRETEAADCYNWTIKASIKGEALRELGVIYNGNFYAISEHPIYNSTSLPPPPPPEEEDEPSNTPTPTPIPVPVSTSSSVSPSTAGPSTTRPPPLAVRQRSIALRHQDDIEEEEEMRL